MVFDVPRTPDHGDLTKHPYTERRQILQEQLRSRLRHPVWRTLKDGV